MAIDHRGRVLVGFTLREHEGLSTRGNPSLALHVLRFTPDGTLDFNFPVPTGHWLGNGFYLDSEDRILTWTSDTLRSVFEGVATPGRVQVTSPVASCAQRCTILQSPSRRTLLLGDVPGFGKALTYIDTASSPPHVIKSCEQAAPYYLGTITDTFDYFARQDSRLDATIQRWPFCDYGKVTDTPIDAAGFIHALNDESFVLVYHEAVRVLSKDGRTKYTWMMPKHDVPSNHVSSDDQGKRFAVQVLTYRGGSRVLDISPDLVSRNISLYDAKTGRQIASIPAKTKHDFAFSFCLGPDGRQLAVLEDGIVTVQRIE